VTPEKQRGFEAALADRNNDLERELKAEREMNEQLGERLHEMQTTVEVQAEALGRNDQQLMDFIGKLNGIMGGEVANEEGAIARMTFLRRESARLYAIRAIVNNNYDADTELLAQLAASLRMKVEHPGSDDVLARCEQLADVETKNAELYRLNIEAERELCKMREREAE